MAALLSASRKKPRDGAVSILTASVLSLEQSEKSQGLEDLWLRWLHLLPLKETSDDLNLDDLRDCSKILPAPMRLPRVALLSRKNEPVDCMFTEKKPISSSDSGWTTRKQITGHSIGRARERDWNHFQPISFMTPHHPHSKQLVFVVSCTEVSIQMHSHREFNTYSLQWYVTGWHLVIRKNKAAELDNEVRSEKSQRC